MANFLRDDSVSTEHNSNLLNLGLIGGGVDQSDNSAVAVGGGAVAASGGSTANVASGIGAVANQGGGTVNQAFDGSQVISDAVVGQNAHNSPGALQVGHDAHGAFNTGAVVGVQSGDEAIGNVVGSGNQTVTVLGDADGTGFGLGGSTVGVASGNAIHGDGAISGLGGAQNQSHIFADHGAAVGGHDAAGFNAQDFSTHVEKVNLTEVDHSTNVTTAQDHSLSLADQDFAPKHVDIDHSQFAGDDISSFFHA
jgi:hypothetical protein